MHGFLPVVLAGLVNFAASAPSSSVQVNLNRLFTQANSNKLANLQKTCNDLVLKGHRNFCNPSNIAVRREYGSLSLAERKNYIDAVLCLQKKPSKTPSAVAPGAKTRYVDSPQTSPIFNGDPYSLSGNGAFIPGRGPTVLYLLYQNILYNLSLPAGLGGGCVTTGPFATYTVNLAGRGPAPLGLQSAPRCLKRDIGPGTGQLFNKYSDVLDLLTNHASIDDFQLALQGKPGTNSIGVHGGGHYTIGGDPGGDVFGSPGDPAFYLHHAMVDRVWTAWQDLDAGRRQSAVAGTGTFLNVPPSANVTLDTVLDLGYAAECMKGEAAGRKMREVMSTTGGPFCYYYAPPGR